MDSFTMIARFFQEGGVFMYPIMLVLAVGVAIAIERYVFLNNSKRNNTRMWDQLMPMVKKGDLQQAINVTTKSGADIGLAELSEITFDFHWVDFTWS